MEKKTTHTQWQCIKKQYEVDAYLFVNGSIAIVSHKKCVSFQLNLKECQLRKMHKHKESKKILLISRNILNGGIISIHSENYLSPRLTNYLNQRERKQNVQFNIEANMLCLEEKLTSLLQNATACTYFKWVWIIFKRRKNNCTRVSLLQQF